MKISDRFGNLISSGRKAGVILSGPPGTWRVAQNNLNLHWSFEEFAQTGRGLRRWEPQFLALNSDDLLAFLQRCQLLDGTGRKVLKLLPRWIGLGVRK
ncbi:MAG: hypothetical protein ABJN26_06240 [Stappiaceae bacterium]